MRDGGICDFLLSVGKETIQGQPYFVLKPEYWAKNWTCHLTIYVTPLASKFLNFFILHFLYKVEIIVVPRLLGLF